MKTARRHLFILPRTNEVIGFLMLFAVITGDWRAIIPVAAIRGRIVGPAF